MSVADATITRQIQAPARLAIEQFGEFNWTGGSVYLQNLLKALRSLPDAERPYTTLARQRGELPYNAEVDRLVEIPPGPRPTKAQRLKNLILREIGMAPKPVKHGIAAVMAENQVDALFTHVIYKGGVGVPLIGWIPDFQYLHLPEMNKPDELMQVRKYHSDVIAQSKVLLVSSNDVLKDLATFSPEAARGAHVIPFVAQIPESIYAADPAPICQKYHIPPRFFYLPNQFWKHKNHLLVLEAMKILMQRSVDICVVCTGTTTDWRNPNFFASFLTAIAERGVHDSIRILGLVPRADVYDLHRQSLALLQPSLFEGWSTSIEEAKSIGKQVVASDLAIHREQVPDAAFFESTNAESLANVLQQVSQASVPGPDLNREAVARLDFKGRELQFARRFNTVIRQAIGDVRET